jgi:hypothetical protein
MAPEAAGNLAVLDVERTGSKYVCQVHRFDPIHWQDPAILHVSFAATNPPPGYESVAGGIVYVDRAGYQAKSYSANLGKQGQRFSWRHPVHRNGLMAVVVLPPDYTLPTVDDANPIFVESKVLESGRLALHWETPDNKRHEAEFSWRMDRTQLTLDGLRDHSALLNEESAKRRQIAAQSQESSASSFPVWAAKAGAIFGGFTLIFFMVVVFATMAGRSIPPSGRFPVIAVLALGVAMATAFLGGDAVAKGQLPIPFLKDNPIQFSVFGGIAVFVIVLLVGNAVFGPSAKDDVGSNPPVSSQHPLPQRAEPQLSRENVCNFYGEAASGSSAWNKDEACTIPRIQFLDTNYHQPTFICCGGGATSPTTATDVPAGIEVIVDGGHFWSVQNPRLVEDRFSIHTYCGPAPAGGPGCNVKVKVWAHFRQ